jgi:hypothetical protein
MSRTVFKPMVRIPGIPVAIVTTLVLILAVHAKAVDKTADSASAEDAIRANVDSYVAAYNRGDAKAVAAHWSDSGE